MVRRIARPVVLAAALALVAAGCGDSKESSGSTTTVQAARSDACKTLKYSKASGGGEFVDLGWMANSGNNTSFDPGVVQTVDENQITTALFDGLTDFDFTDTCEPKLKGLVASKWTVNDDATEYVFTIKKGLEFSNGDPVLPSSFKIAWTRLGSPDLASPYGYLVSYIEGGEALMNGDSTELSGVTADDTAMTLTVKMSAPNADFPAMVSMSNFSPISAADFAKIGNATGWGTEGISIGNGPYKLESADAPDSGEVVLVRNDKWAGNVLGDKKANLDKITFRLSTDVDAAYSAFENGEGDAAAIPSGQFSSAKGKYGNTIDEGLLATYYFVFGQDDPQLGGDKNVKLREAISMAIDREEINNKVYEGTRTISTGITPPGIPGFKADICKFCATDAEAAKKAFAEWTDAGGKLTEPIKVDFNSGGSHQDVAAIIQANVKDVLGIDVELNPIDEGYFKVVAEDGGCHLCRSGWQADYPTYGNFMVDLFGAISIGGNNFGKYDNETFEKLIAQAQSEPDATKRGELYNQAEEQLLNTDVAAVPLNWYSGDRVYAEGVTNYITPPSGFVLWERVGKKS